MLSNISIGSDPEFGVVDSVTNEAKSVIGYLGGSKEEPLSLGNGCARQEDNVGAELTIPPCKNKEDFYKYITEGRAAIDKILSENWLKTTAVSSLRYNKEELDHPKAMEFGCDPAYDVYERAEAFRPSPEEVGNLRSFGCHIHIGWDGDKSVATLESIVKVCDLLLGVPSIILDTDADRRSIYGKAGEFRICNYGLEYRTLGGAMLAKELTIKWMFDQAMNVVDFFNKKEKFNELFNAERDIVECINTGDAELARKIVAQFELDPVWKTLITA
jgi:hypothetical protein